MDAYNMAGYQPYEKIYDRCAYKGCRIKKNDTHHLFRFPSAHDPRQEIWIQNSGNEHLRSWSSTTLRRAGLCPAHFAPNSFIIGNPNKLTSKAVPMQWTEESSKIMDLDKIGAKNVVEEANVKQIDEVGSVPSPYCDKDLRDFLLAEHVKVATQEDAIPVKKYIFEESILFEEHDCKLEWTSSEPQQSDKRKALVAQVSTKEHLSKALNKIIQLEKVCKSMERKNDVLRRQMRRFRDKLRRAEKRLKSTVTIKRNQKKDVDELLNEQDCTQPAARAMVKLQLHRPGVSYTPEEKHLAKQLYYHSATAYSQLRKAGCNFPGESTVRRWVAETDIRCGTSGNVFENLAERLAQLPPEERVCALKWDTMKIKSYDEYLAVIDLVEGLADLGTLEQKNEKVTNLFVFCVDSINAKNSWRQPLAFFLPTTDMKGPKIKDLVKICLDKLKVAGADVKIIVCDQGLANKTALTSPLHFNVSVNNQEFEHNGKTYNGSFDFPHLIKRLIFHLKDKNVLYCNGEPIVAFQDFVETWTIDARKTKSNLLGHISDAHLFPDNFQTMNIKRAFQVLSRTFASAIKLAASDPNELQSETWQVSAAFAERLNDVIDAHNAFRLISSNPMRRPLSSRNPAIEETLLNFADWASKWSQSPDKTIRAPCFDGLVITARAIVKTYRELAEEFPGFELAAGLCNQDSVENLLSKIRQLAGHKPNPTAQMARLALRHIISKGYIYAPATEATSRVHRLNH